MIGVGERVLHKARPLTGKGVASREDAEGRLLVIFDPVAPDGDPEAAYVPPPRWVHPDLLMPEMIEERSL